MPHTPPPTDPAHDSQTLAALRAEGVELAALRAALVDARAKVQEQQRKARDFPSSPKTGEGWSEWIAARRVMIAAQTDAHRVEADLVMREIELSQKLLSQLINL